MNGRETLTAGLAWVIGYDRGAPCIIVDVLTSSANGDLTCTMTDTLRTYGFEVDRVINKLGRSSRNRRQLLDSREFALTTRR